MVYEARAGQTFLLGASTWRIEEITRDRVLVSPAPGLPGRRAVLEGRGRRPARTSSARRSAPPRASSPRLGDATALERLRDEYLLDERAARNLLAFLRDQADATGAVPSDRTIVVERFRDEIGDWRVCILTPFGGRVHAPWAMAITARLRESLGLDAQSIWSDDGIAIHFPDADVPPPGARPRCSTRPRSRISSSPSSARPRSSAPASARTPPARSSSRGAGPVSGRRSGSSG